jgi:2,5-furandicarboxylate decarboxylase 1
MPWGLEVDNLLTLIHGIDFIPKMKKESPRLQKVHMTPGTFGSHVILGLDAEDKGEVRRALTLALSFPYVKRAIAVDSDVDPEDPQEVEWSLATRFQADRDVIVLQGLSGHSIDPSTGENFSTAKLGMDATRPRSEGFEKIDVPEEVKQQLNSTLIQVRRRVLEMKK